MAKAKKNVDTLESILNEAAHLFWKKGIDHVTFSDVAQKVGVSQPALYSYVENKMDLLSQVCLWSIQKGRAFIDSQLNPRDRALENLQAYVRANLSFFYEQKVHSHSLIALYYFAMSSPHLNKLYRATQAASISRMSIYLIQAQNEGILQAGCEDSLSASIHAVLIGYSYRAIYSLNRAESEKCQSDCWTDIEKMLSFCRIKKHRPQ